MLKLIIKYGLFVFVSMSVGAQNLSPYENIKVSFSADMVQYHVSSVQSQQRVAVILTPSGVRMASSSLLGSNVDGVYIQNFAKAKSWLVAKKTKMYAELVRDDEGSDEELVGESGIMSTRPCVIAESALRSQSLIEKKGDISTWQCVYDDLKVKQYFSSRWGVVIKEEWSTGMVFEMEKITKVEFQPEYFSPPENYEKVELEHLFMGRPALEMYEG